MHAKRVGRRRWLLVLERGEEIVSTVTSFLEEMDVRGGYVNGIGAVRDHVLGWFDLDAKEYVKRTFEEVMELTALFGTVGCVDGKPTLHAHASVSGPELIAFAGHLVRAEVAVTAELVLADFEIELAREVDEEVGLALFRVASPETKEEASGE